MTLNSDWHIRCLHLILKTKTNSINKLLEPTRVKQKIKFELDFLFLSTLHNKITTTYNPVKFLTRY